MPTPARTSLSQIVAVGRDIIEADGLDGLTMQRVADSVGVRAPSLYRHVRGRDELVRRIAEDVIVELRDTLDSAASTGDSQEDLRRLAHAFRDFAKRQPAAFGLLTAPLPAKSRPDPALLAEASRAVLRVAGELAGPEHRLEAARTIVAWANGFIGMELAGAFRLGGDIDRAFTYGVSRLGDALQDRET